ncbi:MAG: RHS repeat-associated core domain-containing protein, partial [Leptospirales bacterium]
AHRYDTSFPYSAKTTLYTGNSDPAFVSRTYVDGLGRGVHSVKSASGGQYVRSGRTLYDGAGRPLRRGQTQWAGAGEIDTFIAHTILRNPTSYEYDGVGRVIRTTLPQAEGESSPTTISVVYSDPYQVVQHHSGGQSKRSLSNGRGETLFVEDFGTGDGGQNVSAKVGFCYDVAGNMIKKSDLNGGQSMSCSGAGGSTVPAKDVASGQNHAYWIYDAFGQLRAKSDPDFGVSSYVLNAFGDLTSMTDAATRTTSITYDRLGRPETKLLPNGEGLVAYTYDSYGGSANAIGRLARLEDATQIKNFSYDELGRTSREIREIKNPGVIDLDVPYTTEYRYDLLGRVKAIDYPEHPLANQKIRVCYDYGTAGYITGVAANTDAAGWPMFGGGCDSNRKDIVSNITYNEFGQTASFALGNGVTTNYTHDVRGRIIRIRSEGQVSGATKTLQDAVYNFNPNNSIASVANTATAYTTSYNYTYDGLNRLTNANGMYVEIDDGSGTANTTPQEYKLAYGYTANGNLIRKDTINPTTDALEDRWSYNYTNHAVTSIDSTATGAGRHDLMYDAVGNVTYQKDNVTGFEKELTFNSYNRIHTVRDVGRDLIVGTYRYDDGGFRVQKTANLLKGGQYKDVNILYPSMFFGLEHIAEDSTTSAINNIYLNGVRVAAMAQNGALAYYLTDQVDSVSHVLDDAAETLTRIQYKPYGETFAHKGDQDFAPKYNSQELDPESKLYYYNARYYDPQISRFTSPDTVLDGGAYYTQAWNRYMNVRGNPIRYKDPTGHQHIADLAVNDEQVRTHSVRSQDGSGSIEKWTYQSVREEERSQGILQDIVSEGKHGTRRTVVSLARFDDGTLDEDTVIVERWSLDANKEWQLGHIWKATNDVDRKAASAEGWGGGTVRDANTGEEISIIRFQGLQEVAKDNSQSNANVEIGLYYEAGKPETPGTSTQLSYIEVYNRVTGKWVGRRDRDQNWTFDSSPDKIPPEHEDRHHHEIEQENFSVTRQGFHEVLEMTGDGQYDFGPKPWRKP